MHHNKMVRKTKPSRPFSIFNYATANIKQKDCPSGQSFSQQRQLSIREIYNFQSALLGHMHGLSGTA